MMELFPVALDGQENLHAIVGALQCMITWMSKVETCPFLLPSSRVLCTGVVIAGSGHRRE